MVDKGVNELKPTVIEADNLIHLGNIIKNRLVLQGRSIRWFAQQMNCDRSNMYKLLTRNHLDSNFILRASRILEHDFFKDVSELLQSSDYFSKASH